jgi:hypothetical protein
LALTQLPQLCHFVSVQWNHTCPLLAVPTAIGTNDWFLPNRMCPNTYRDLQRVYVSALQISQNLHLWLRLPPLNPKAAAPLKRLAAGRGHLFAGPAGSEGQLLHWSPRLDDASTLPAGGKACRTEDWDSAPAAELQPSSASWADGSSSKMAATAMCVDAAAGRLWCGFEDGSVHVWAVEAAAAAAGGHGSAAQAAVWLYGWKAHNGKVRSIVFTPAGHLFTGGCSTRGAVQ